MIQYLADSPPFFRSSYIWPHKQNFGAESKTFYDEDEFLDFLRNDPRSGTLWMDHQGLQIVANAYQMKGHILTVGVQGMQERERGGLI